MKINEMEWPDPKEERNILLTSRRCLRYYVYFINKKGIAYMKYIYLCFCILLCSSNGIADTIITFGKVSKDIGNNGPLIENNFQYEALGDSWSLQDPFSTGNKCLATFWGIPNAVGNKVTFHSLNNSKFYIRSIDIAGVTDGFRNDVAIVNAYSDGKLISSKELYAFNREWSTVLVINIISEPIDLLEIEVIEVNNAALLFDNLVILPYPLENKFLLYFPAFLKK